MISKSLAIIIPAFNEEDRLPTTLKALHTYLENSKLGSNIQLFIVNDGSTDNSILTATEALKSFTIQTQIINLPQNMGKGYAVKHAFLNIPEFDYYYLADADLSAQWQTMSDFLILAENGNLDCIIASRALPESDVKTSLIKKTLGNLGNIPIKLLLGLDFEDTQCGYKLFSKNCLPAFKIQKLDRWGFDFELLYIIKEMGLSIKEVGIEWQNREGSNVQHSDYLKTFKELGDVYSRRARIKELIEKFHQNQAS